MAKEITPSPEKKASKTECADRRCPKHGGLKTHGRIFEGVVSSTKAPSTASIVISFHRKVPKYERLEKRRSKLHVHIPACRTVKEGDRIKIMETRKLSKTKNFVIID
ncbi:30S ribosomal protein S17 [Candidatus Micrarchaeota archaeon]|nr:30S ribosomal protein S17 [Candidatus Micrarchaeota archaeon]